MTSEISPDGEIDVSVLVAIRNEEGYIERCINSLVDQDFPEEKYQVIVADGLSLDRTRDIIKSYERQFPRLIKVVDNPGITQANGRIIALHNARGRIIMYLDGHSSVTRHHISELVKSLDDSADSVALLGPTFKLLVMKLLWEK